MVPKFQFVIYNETLYPNGVIVNTPIGWKDSALSLVRDQVFQSLIEEFKGSFMWWGLARTVLLEIEALGDDQIARLVVRIAYSGDFEDMFEGVFNLEQLQDIPFKSKSYKLDIPIIRDDFWAKFINHYKTSVDIQSALDLYNIPASVISPVTLTLTSQKITQRYKAESGADLPLLTVAIYDGLDNTNYGSLDVFSEIELEEVGEKVDTGNDITSSPKTLFKFTYGGVYQIDITVFAWGDVAPTYQTNPDVDVFIQRNNGSPVAFTRTDYGTDGIDGVTGYTYSDTLNIVAGDTIMIFLRNSELTTGTPATVRIPGKPSSYPGPGDLISTIDIEAVTVHPASNAVAMRIHETLQSIIDRITGVSNSLYSKYFGRTDTSPIPYDDDGCGSAYALLKGKHVRGYTFEQKPYADSVSDFWNGANPLFNLGLTYERIERDNFVNFLKNSFFDPPFESNVDWYATGPGTAPWADPFATTTLIGPSGVSDLLEQDFPVKPIGDYRLIFTNALNSAGVSDPTYNCVIKLKLLGVVVQTIYNANVVVSIAGDTTTTQDFTAVSAFDNIEVEAEFVSSPLSTIELIFNEIQLQFHYTSQKVIRVEPKSYFFNSAISVNFSNLRGVKRRKDIEKIFKTMENGFAEWSIESASGIDDVQTKSERHTRFATIGQIFTALSTWFAASLGIEQVRRVQSLQPTTDSPIDDKTVIIALNKTSMDVPELDENFDSITGLMHSETRYNTRLSVARIFTRWKNWFAGCLQTGDNADFYFSTGQGNMDMVSTLSASDCEGDGEPLAENGTIVNDATRLFTPGVWEFSTPMVHAQYKLIEASREKAIGVSKTASGHVPASILDLNWQYMDGTGKFIVLIK